MDLKAVLLLDKRDSLCSNIKILGRSFIELQLDSIVATGIKEVHILTSKEYIYQKNDARFYFHKYNSDQGLLKYLDQLKLTSDILLINDNSLFSDNDLSSFISDFKSRRLSMSAMVSDKDVDAYYYPQIENNIIKRIITDKKDKTFSGAFLLAKDTVNSALAAGIKLFYEELFNWLLKNNRIVNTYNPQEHFMQIDSLTAWRNENYQMLKLPIFEIDTPKIKDSFIGKNTEIDFTSFIEGSCYIGSNVSIGKNCLIKDSIIQSGTVIGDDCTIRATIIGEQTNINSKTVLENTTISDQCQLMGNIRIKHLKLAQRSIINKYSETNDEQ